VHVNRAFTPINLQSQVDIDVALLTIYQWNFFIFFLILWLRVVLAFDFLDRIILLVPLSFKQGYKTTRQFLFIIISFMC